MKGAATSLRTPAGEGTENGILQAWEIFEQMRIDADLVTLSACETGLGREMGGEGLIGLTRAFQYAGARSVLSSLWSVSDESTSSLMHEFYRNLKEGKNKAESLRLAQMSFLRKQESTKALPDTSLEKGKEADSTRPLPFHTRNFQHPFYWAAFLLNGDWK